MPELRKTIEAALFMSPNAISLSELCRLCSTDDLGAVREAIEELQRFYNESSALEISDVGDNYQLRVKQAHEESVKHLAASVQFGKSVMKTLAYIAYKQPILQSQLIRFRTSKAYEDIALLEERGFIMREPKGRSFVVRTTKKFLKYFGKDAVKLRDKLELQAPVSANEGQEQNQI